jgi:hypothetical protein
MMNSLLWLQMISALFKVFRIFLFEKFTLVMSITWWLIMLAAAVIFYWFDYRIAIFVVTTGILGHFWYRGWVQQFKPLLIKTGDLVEYAEPSASFDAAFSRGVVMSTIPHDEVLRRKLFDAEQVMEYERFYLVSTGKKSKAIPYEWIMQIEVEELPLPTA